MILFSASTMGFYDTDIHTVDGIPKDAKEISRELRDEMVKGQGQTQLIADENGYPSLQKNKMAKRQDAKQVFGILALSH